MHACSRNRRPRPFRAVATTALLALAALASVVSGASAATTLTIAAQSPTITWGQATSLQGVAGPAGASETLVVEQQVGTTWAQVGQVATVAASGAWQLAVKPATGTTYRVRTADSTVASGAVRVAVAPRLTVRASRGVAFLGAPMSVGVTPASFTGTVTAKVVQGTSTTSMRIHLRRGSAHVSLPIEGTGHFGVTVSTSATPAFAAASAVTGNASTGRNLRGGSSGADVSGILRRLDKLGFHTPGHGSRYTFAVGEVTLAFQKAHGLPRTYVWGSREWRELNHARRQQPMDPKDASLHIEVSKHRQILQLVDGGVVLGTIAVSTGATGNTPVGTFHVYQKGGSHLPNFMAFYANFGIHGYSPVPEYPASHGCVREPVWASRWTFAHAKIGTPVHVHP